MIKVNEIAFVGYPVRDRAKAREFYEGLFELKPTMDQDMGEHFWTEYDIGTGTFALSNYWYPAAEPAMGLTVAFEVGNYDETLALLKSKGVRIMESHESRVCFMSMVTDPDGNSLWIHKRKSAPVSPEKVMDIAFVCQPITDRPRANAFYEGLFGLSRTQPEHTQPDGFWAEYNIGAGTMAVCNYWKPSSKPSTSPSLALEVEDFSTAVAELTAAAVPFPLAPMETPICHLAVVMDPDGNSLFIHQRKANVA